MGTCYECRVTIDGVEHQRACLVTSASRHAGRSPARSTDDRARPCDVLVIGGGPAGIAAASRAAERARERLLVDEGLAPGGQIWRASTAAGNARSARRWVDRLARSGAAIMALDERRRHRAGGRRLSRRRRRAGRRHRRSTRGAVVLATGARERFLPFPGWTLPNVFGVGGAQALLKSGMSVRGKRVVVAGSDRCCSPVAASLACARRARSRSSPSRRRSRRVARFAASLWRSPSRCGCRRSRLRARLGDDAVRDGHVDRARDGDVARRVGDDHGRTNDARTIECDVLCAAFGLRPNVGARAARSDVRLATDGVQRRRRQATTRRRRLLRRRADGDRRRRSVARRGRDRRSRGGRRIADAGASWRRALACVARPSSSRRRLRFARSCSTLATDDTIVVPLRGRAARRARSCVDLSAGEALHASRAWARARAESAAPR